MSALAGERRVRLASYGGEVRAGGWLQPASAEELAAVLGDASRAGRRVTFRGGGCAFDTQGLNTDLMISLERLGELRFAEERGEMRVVAGGGVRWGELVRATHRRGGLPPVIVTTEQASVAGTTSSNAVSRWSPVRGPDAAHVRAVELVTMRGERLRLSADDGDSDNDDNDELLAGVCGGLGYLGAIASVELPLVPTPHDQIETQVVAAGATAAVLAACAPAHLPTDGVSTRYGVLHADLRRGLAYQARPVSGQTPRRYLAVHQPRSALRLLGELLLLTHAGSPLVSELAYRLHRDRYVDPLFDYTFFMEGDARLRLAGRRLGWGLRIVQQSFVVAVDDAAELIERARRCFAAHEIVPMLSDVLYCPADRALLSATRGRGGFVVSFAFSPRTAGRHARVCAALTRLASVCRQLRGRIRLGKHVHAAPEDLAEMYAEALPRFSRLKRRLDPDGLLRNEFLERTFPGIS